MPEIEDLTYNTIRTGSKPWHYGYKDDIKGTPVGFSITLKNALKMRTARSRMSNLYKLQPPVLALIEQSMEGCTTEIYKRSIN